jgi:hypothetical protein
MADADDELTCNFVVVDAVDGAAAPEGQPGSAVIAKAARERSAEDQRTILEEYQTMRGDFGHE